MESYLRFALLALVGVVVVLVIFEFAFRRRKANYDRLTTRHDLANLISMESAVTPFKQTEPKFEMGNINNFEEEAFITSTELRNIANSKNIAKNYAQSIKKPTPPKKHSPSDLLVLMVFAKPGQTFASYDLLQALTSAGLEFGDMNIFHFYQMTIKGRQPLFSLASATEPGEFDLNQIGKISCTGLTLFANLTDAPDPQYVFDLMLKTAEQLADDLDGDIRATPRTPWTESIKRQYQQRVSEYQNTAIA